MSTEESKKSGHGPSVELKVINEDDGREFSLSAPPQSTVADAIATMYETFIGRARKPGDRLRCESTGEDVFSHSADHLQGYVSGRCRGATWLFVSETGGA